MKQLHTFDEVFDSQKVFRKALEALINAGALDTFGYNRATLLGALDNLLLYANIVRVENE